jgi:hypothetical protein
MNNKSKIVLGLAAMVAGTVGVGTTATFAWFTTQNTASVSFANAHVVSDNASIQVQYFEVTNNHIDGTKVTAGKTTAGGSVTIAGASVECRDISGDGSTFYRPHWTTFNTTADTMNSANNDATKSNYVTFGVAVTNKGKADTKVFIGKDSSVTGTVVTAEDGSKSTPTANTNAATSTRVAVFEGSTQTGATTLVSTWQYSAASTAVNTDFKYIKADATATGAALAYACTGYTLASPDAATFHAGGFSAAATYADTTKGRLLTTFTKQNETRYLIISMWIEGTLSSADDTCIGGDVSLDFKLEAYANA